MIQLNHGYRKRFTTEVAGIATAADSTPTAILYRNGSASGVTVTVLTTAETGVYLATFTTLDVGDSWAKTDHLELLISATIDGDAGYKVVLWDSDSDPDAPMRGTDGANTATPLDSTQTQQAAAAAIASNSTISNLDSMIENVSGFRFTKKAIEQTTGGMQAYPGLKRSISDQSPINFAWPTSDESITAEKSFNGGSYSSIEGTITFLRTENDEHWYSLSYNASDRPSQEGTVRYKLNDGQVVKYLNLYVYDTAEKVNELLGPEIAETKTHAAVSALNTQK